MYESIKDSNWKINVNNPEYLVENLKNFHYIDYNDYTNWSVLKNKIVAI